MGKLKLKKWDVTKHLKDPEDCRLYLNACADDDAGDGKVIRLALSNIARAGNMSELAGKADVTRDGLYKALSENGNPSFTLMIKIARALGLELRFDSVH
ncbi:MAG: putative addiction module antidote protein [Mariprofundaceae bacterium]